MDRVIDSRRSACPLFQAEGRGSTPTSALSLWFGALSVPTAITLNRLWHSRLPVVIRSNITRTARHVCYGAQCGGVYYACAIWTTPVARLLPQGGTWLELRRMAIAPDAPKNTASRFLGWMARNLKRRFTDLSTLVSYQDTEVHTGTIYRAAGWHPVTLADPRCRPWNNAARVRNDAQSTAPKRRWEKAVRPEVEQ